jgi:2-aminoadipate transaminase
MSDGTLPIPMPLAWSGKAKRTKEQPISFLIAEAMRNPKLINLAAGLVDPYSLPVETVRRLASDILSDTDRGRRALQYDTTAGLAELRRLCHRHLAGLEGVSPEALPYSPEEIIVTTGSQQALYLIGDLLVDPGDIVIAANPSYFVYTGTLQSLGAHVMAVPMDENGMDVDAVAALLARLDSQGKLDRVKFVYCTSYFDNPTGLSLSPDRRGKLFDLIHRYSRKHRILILEDAAYRELRYDGVDVRSIKSHDTQNLFVATSHTFSKPFSPGLKLGYTAMPKDLAHAMLQQKGNHDFGSSSLAMHLAAAAMTDGSYGRQVELLKATYRAKRDRVLAALDKAFGPGSEGSAMGVRWTRPAGGLYVWLTLPTGVDTSRTGPLFATALDIGVLYVPGDYCFQPDDAGHVPTNHLRLCFGQLHPDQIEPGIERLVQALRQVMPAAGKASVV